MSLIEKALNKASKEIKSPSSEDGQISIDPTNIVSPPAHPRRSIWMLLVSGLLLLSVVMVSIFLFVSPQSRPPHSKDVTTQVTSLESSPAPLAKDSSGHAETPSAKLLATSPAKENENQEQAPKEAYNPSLPSPSSQESQPVPLMNNHPRLPAANHSAGESRALSQVSLPQEPTAALLNEAYAYGEKGNYRQAVERYDSILSLHPQHYEALVNRGIVYQKMGDLEKAERDLLLAAQMRPDDPILLNSLGVLYVAKGDEDKARGYLARAGDATAFINLALIYWKGGDWGKVVSCLQEGKQKDPQDPYVPYYLGLLYLQRGSADLGHGELQNAVILARKRGLTELVQTIESISLGH